MKSFWCIESCHWLLNFLFRQTSLYLSTLQVILNLSISFYSFVTHIFCNYISMMTEIYILIMNFSCDCLWTVNAAMWYLSNSLTIWIFLPYRQPWCSEFLRSVLPWPLSGTSPPLCSLGNITFLPHRERLVDAFCSFNHSFS